MSEAAFPPSRLITRGPKRHWFAYYDKWQVDPSGRYALGMEVDFEGRSPAPDDTIKIGMIDLHRGDEWIELGESRAWCWQQGCMLQWRPGSASEILWNDREQDRFVCRIMDVKTRRMRTLPFPVYAIAADGRTAVAPDFRRIQDTRPGYGYPGLPDPFAAAPAPEESGIWRMDLETGERRLIVSLAGMARIPFPGGSLSRCKQWFNHLLFNPAGTRFVFLHRWRARPEDKGFGTRMLTAAPDGSDIRVVDDYGKTSHFIWRDDGHILAWAAQASHGPAFYLFADGDPAATRPVGLGMMVRDGHCSYLPGGEWILNDTYPGAGDRQIEVYLYHPAANRRLAIGRFDSPPEYTGEWRCDAHPRFSRDGRFVIVDTVAQGQGRQMRLIDIAAMPA